MKHETILFLDSNVCELLIVKRTDMDILSVYPDTAETREIFNRYNSITTQPTFLILNNTNQDHA